MVVASGDVASDSAILWAQPTVEGAVALRVGLDAALTTAVFEDSMNATPLAPAKFDVSALAPATRYYYAASDAAGARRDGEFVTPAIEGFSGLRFGVTGDWRGELAPYPSISNAPAERLDFFVALGDTIYADVPSPAVPNGTATTLDELLRKHAEVYLSRLGMASLADLRASTAWYSMIDDHEVVNDFAGGAAPASDPRFAAEDAAYINRSARYLAGLSAFEAFHPIRAERYGDTGDPRTSGAHKLYRARRFGQTAAMFLLDARSFRDPEIESRFLDADAFYRDAFDPSRTMLGVVQLADLQADLLAAQRNGVLWKFVLVPEPIQNIGPILGGDRFEGYSSERTALLRFIRDNAIRNVVFVTADIHCTLINNLTYQENLDGPQIPLDSWEISTGAVAYAAPFGPTTVELVRSTPVIGPLFGLLYDDLDRDGKDALLTSALNFLLREWGFDPIGLDDSPLPATLLDGAWASLHTYGWTLFEIDADTQALTVTTYGIDWYDESELAQAPQEIANRKPAVVSRFRVEASR